jgi:hypothetical protein
VFFADLPASIGWQAGDGPLLRWAYRDTSLRSYLMNQFSIERARRGPVLFFVGAGDSLRDLTDDPMILPSFAYGMILSGRPDAAVDALTLAIARVPSDRDLRYWRAWARLGAGDSAGALSDLRAAGIEPASRIGRGENALAAGGIADTAARVSQLVALRARAGLHPQVHARLAALWLASPAHRKDGAIEAYAFRILAPDDPDAWRKLASAQLAEGLHEPALRSLETYVRIGGSAAAEDREVRQVIRSLRRVVHGDIASQELHASRQP